MANAVCIHFGVASRCTNPLSAVNNDGKQQKLLCPTACCCLHPSAIKDVAATCALVCFNMDKDFRDTQYNMWHVKW